MSSSSFSLTAYPPLLAFHISPLTAMEIKETFVAHPHSLNSKAYLKYTQYGSAALLMVTGRSRTAVCNVPADCRN